MRKVKRFSEGGVTEDDLEKANASDDPIYTLNKINGFTDTEDSGAFKSSDSSTVTPKSKSFKEAFASARKDGEKYFEWQGKKYTTELAKPAAKVAAKPTPEERAPVAKAKYETSYDRMNRQNRESAAAKKSATENSRPTLQRNIRESGSGRVNPKTLLPEVGMKKGGLTASRRADGCAIRGKTRA